MVLYFFFPVFSFVCFESFVVPSSSDFLPLSSAMILYRFSLATLFVLGSLASAQVALAQRELKDIPIPDAEEERKTFVLPEGFEVNLFAADPGIHKPVQMNFDPQGRLWIAASEVYPQIAPGLQSITSALFNMANDRASRDAWFADPNGYADKYLLEGRHKKLLVDFDAPGIVATGVHPLLIFLVHMHVERERGKSV